MALVGYARVSSVGQTLAVQLDKLQQCDKVFQEKVSGINAKRPQLQACLEYVRQGDTLMVTKLDRLARSTLHLCQIAAELERKQVALEVLDQNIDTNSATGRLLFNMLGAIAQFETEIRAERQREGIQKARERGVRFGKRGFYRFGEISNAKSVDQWAKMSLRMAFYCCQDILPTLGRPKPALLKQKKWTKQKEIYYAIFT
jgi:DNA invertase Pin-like site-specific DNA recombinase